MIKIYVLFFSCLLLASCANNTNPAATQSTYSAVTTAPVLADTVSVNTCKLRFRTDAGKPIDFKIGVDLSLSTDIHILLENPYFFKRVSAIVVRGKRPVSAKDYLNQKEVIIEKSFFAIAQPGDRICIDLAEVVKEVNGVKTLVQLDVPVFNIPLN